MRPSLTLIDDELMIEVDQRGKQLHLTHEALNHHLRPMVLETSALIEDKHSTLSPVDPLQVLLDQVVEGTRIHSKSLKMPLQRYGANRLPLVLLDQAQCLNIIE